MQKLLTAFLGSSLLFVGCSKPGTTSASKEDFSGHVAATLASHVVLKSSPGPNPVTPSSDICPNCNGVGKVGDGRTMLTCGECNGTGKKKKVSETVMVDEKSIDVIVAAVVAKMAARPQPAASPPPLPVDVDISDESVAKIKDAVIAELKASAADIIQETRQKLGMGPVQEEPVVKEPEAKEPAVNPFPTQSVRKPLPAGISNTNLQATVRADGYPGCVYCIEFKNNLAPSLRAAKWTVDYIDESEPQPGIGYPVIEVHGWGLKKVHTGQMTMSDFTVICNELRAAAGK